jgi:hypothetical protein
LGLPIQAPRPRQPSALLLASLCSFLTPAATAAGLEIRLVEGDDAIHTAASRSYQGFGVLVVNDRGEPQPGVRVTFQLPGSGPTGVFPGGGRTESVLTDSLGKASVWGIQWGEHTGSCTITILARSDNASAGTALTVRIVSPENKRPQTGPREGVSFEVAVPAAEVAVPARTPEPPAPKTPPEWEISKPRPGVILTSGPERLERLPGSGRKWLWISLAASGAAGGLLYLTRQPSAAPPAAVAAGPRLVLGPPSITIGRP